jgi:hypothetical protein
VTQVQIHARLADEPGIRFGIANGVLVAMLFVAGVTRLQVSETEFLTVILAGLVSIGLTLAMTAWISIVAWALFTGFVENQYGELTFDHGDLVRLAVFAVSIVALAVFTRRTYQVIKENAHG